MKPNIYDFKLLADYVDQKLDAATTKEIQNLLTKSEVASSIVEGIKFFYQQKDATRTELEQYLNDLQLTHEVQLHQPIPTDTITKKQKPKTTILLTYWGTIAATLCIFLIGFIIINSSATQPLPALAENHLEKYPAPNETYRGQEINIQQEWKTAIRAYKNDQYTSAIVVLEKIIAVQKAQHPTTELPDKYHFYLGLCYLYQKEANPQKAIENLSLIAKKSYSDYHEQANWFLGLAYLTNNQLKEAKKYIKTLDSLAIEGTVYDGKAKKLMGDLEEYEDF